MQQDREGGTRRGQWSLAEVAVLLFQAQFRLVEGTTRLPGKESCSIPM